MKAATCVLAASMLAASTAALTTTVTTSSTHSNEGNSPYVKAMISVSSSSEKEKFTPRFDGLRFIETLVTAHR